MVKRIDNVAVLLPAFNEASGIENAASEICKYLSQCCKRFEICIVDDGSSDKTWEKIEYLSTVFPVRGLRLSRNFGKEAALRAGLECIKTDYVIIMDADLQHPPSVIPEMFTIMLELDADVIDGVKEERGDESLIYKALSLSFYKVFSKLTNINLQQASDFKLLNRKAIDAYLSMTERTLFFRGMSAWIGFKRGVVKYKTHDRLTGTSKWSTSGLIHLAINAIISFSSSLLHLPTYIGLFFCFFAFFVMLESVYKKFMNQSAEGFPTVIVMLGIIGGSILISLGIIGEYMAKIYEEVKRRPTYLVKEEVHYDKKKKNNNNSR
ncbi:MAG TPA: glycosyltransferase family 2 protein [Spirochaetota bacterium]|jgi:dolichol-phosphate mannosyltransferase|nr:glycosyltransferase family 2 protein [Spirochaetota bacterium]HOV08861.1 glycosyltransferase family 2 protein [Spirochaetota bacterium]